MILIAERVIAYLKTDVTLTNLLGNVNNIFAQNVPLRKDKAVVVSTEPGEDQNNIPASVGEFMVEAVVNRSVANAHSVCINIAKRIDLLLNKGEAALTAGSYKIIHINRVDGSGLLIDDDNGEFFYTLKFSYILNES